MSKPANLLLAVLRKRLANEPNAFERRELKRKIREAAAALARDEFEAKAAPLRREMSGAY